MQAIWKFEVLPGAVAIMMPRGAQILSVQTQDTSPNIWALVDPEAALEERRFVTFATGQPIRGNAGRFIGSFQLYDGALVFHLFESV